VGRRPSPTERQLTVFECPKCGKRLQAMPSAEVRCKCGRPMERMKPGRQSARARAPSS
jgi:transcription initiation factor IIE alpha subunit